MARHRTREERESDAHANEMSGGAAILEGERDVLHHAEAPSAHKLAEAGGAARRREREQLGFPPEDRPETAPLVRPPAYSTAKATPPPRQHLRQPASDAAPQDDGATFTHEADSEEHTLVLETLADLLHAVRDGDAEEDEVLRVLDTVARAASRRPVRRVVQQLDAKETRRQILSGMQVDRRHYVVGVEIERDELRAEVQSLKEEVRALRRLKARRR